MLTAARTDFKCGPKPLRLDSSKGLYILHSKGGNVPLTFSRFVHVTSFVTLASVNGLCIGSGAVAESAAVAAHKINILAPVLQRKRYPLELMPTNSTSHILTATGQCGSGQRIRNEAASPLFLTLAVLWRRQTLSAPLPSS